MRIAGRLGHLDYLRNMRMHKPYEGGAPGH